ncbi:MAG: hypothetical protein R3Y27_07470 [Clostridia bacterium]
MDYEARTFKVLIGFDETDSINGDPAEWSSTYDEVKDLYTESTSADFEISEIWNDFSAFSDRFQNITGDYLFSAKVGLVGFMEFSFQDTEDIRLIEGGIITSVNLGFDVTIPFSQLPVFYATFEIGADLVTGITVKEVTQLSFLIDIEFDLPVDIGLGVGSKALSLYLEGGLTGTLGIDFINPTGDYEDDYEDYLYIDITGGAYAEASIFGYLSDRYVDDLVQFELYPDQTADWLKDDEDAVEMFSASSISLMSINDVVDVEEDEEVDVNAIYDSFTAADRDYVETVSMVRTFSASTYSIEESADEDHVYSDTSVYDYSAPVITELGDGELFMVWLDDDGLKDDINKTSLMYSVYTNGAWSTAAAIDETGGSNGAAVVSVTDDGRIDIVWTKAEALDSTASLSSLMAAMEVYYISYEDGEFSESIKITDNAVTETAYAIASTDDSVAITWTENSAGDIMSVTTDSTNSVYLAEIALGETTTVTTTTLASELTETVSETVVYFDGDDVVTGYVADSTLTLGSTSVEGASDVSYVDGVLYYLLDGQVVVIDDGVKTLSDLSVIDNFTVYDGEIYTLVSSNYGSELYKSNAEYTSFIKVTNFDGYVRDYSVATLGEDTVYAINLLEIVEDTEAESLYDNAELLVTYAADFTDLVLGGVYYSDSEIVAGGDVTVNMQVSNAGTADVSSIDVTIGDTTQTVAVEIAVGETETISVTYTLPSEISYTSLDVSITATDSDDYTPSDNTNTFTYGYADAVMSELTLNEIGDGSYTITGSVTNTGFETVEDATVNVYDTLDLTTSIKAIEVGELEVGETYNFTYTVSDEYLTIENKDAVHSLTFKLESETAESSYANNSARITFGELTDYVIYFVKDGEIIGIVDANEFDSFDPKVDGYIFNGWYSNSYYTEDLLVTSVDADLLTDDLYLFGYYTVDANFVEITVTDSEMQKGASQTLTASQNVTWSVSGNESEETTITDDGYFTMGSDETASEITVTATSEKGVTASVTIKVHEHEFKNYTTTTPATCSSYGISTGTCSCGLTSEEYIEMKDHDYSSIYTVDLVATCTSTGSQSYHCMNCDATTGSVEIAMLDHADNDGDGICDTCDYVMPIVEETTTNPIDFFEQIRTFFEDLFEQIRAFFESFGL